MDDTHTTLGRAFRTPAQPDTLAALGRALYCFLSLEESVTAVIYDAGAGDLSETRAKMAGPKQQALEHLANRYRAAPGGADVAHVLDRAAAAFGQARTTIRNELLHAHPFTAGYDEDGTYLPGLAYTAKDGTSWKEVARTPDDLLDLAETIEQALDPLSEAREAVKGLSLEDLKP